VHYCAKKETDEQLKSSQTSAKCCTMQQRTLKRYNSENDANEAETKTTSMTLKSS
jgi:hypothetical protein